MKPYSILVIEDHPATQELLKDFLELQGMQVWMACSCSECLALQGHCQPDLIHCDIKLLDGDGCTLLQQWRDWEVDQHQAPIPAIALSALPKQYVPLDPCSGFQVFVQKPFELDALRLTMHALLDQWSDAE